MQRRRTSHPPTGPARPAGSAPFDCGNPDAQPVFIEVTITIGDAVSTIPKTLVPEFIPAAIQAIIRGADCSPPAQRALPKYSLRREGSMAALTFDGKPAHFKWDAGAPLIRFLLYNPSQSLFGAEVFARAHNCPQLQQRNLKLDKSDPSAPLPERIKELYATIESDTANETERREAQEELDEIQNFQVPEAMQDANVTTKLVRQEITRTCSRLAIAKAQDLSLHPVLTEFARHVRLHILSASCPPLVPPGHLTYTPPSGVKWA